MKNLVLLLLLLPIGLTAQTKGSKILIHNGNSASDNFKILYGVMLDNGYKIVESDKDLLTVKTNDIQAGQSNVHYNIYGRAKDNLIVLSGDLMVNKVILGANANYEPIENRNGRFKYAYSELKKFANLFKAKVTYEQ